MVNVDDAVNFKVGSQTTRVHEQNLSTMDEEFSLLTQISRPLNDKQPYRNIRKSLKGFPCSDNGLFADSMDI